VVDEREFLAAIVAHPHDWAPRLVFADWLEERGDPRAELIRLLEELARPKCTYRNRKEARLRELMNAVVQPIAPIFTNKLGMEFVAIPPGTFRMGSPEDEHGRHRDETPHIVTITRGFFLGRFPVTQEQWQRIRRANPSYWKGKTLPVDNVNRVRALEWIESLRRRDRLAYRLPTEAEWEYACRAGTSTPYFFGRGLSMQQANISGAKSRRSARRGKSRKKSTSVGSFPPNAFGLFDMHGNVWEWCQDSYGEFAPEPKIDPLFQNDSEQFVLRGGSWWNEAERARSAARHSLSATATGSAVGLRLCLSANE
jgi:uncharacterized protein (TIGR02996 family)